MKPSRISLPLVFSALALCISAYTAYTTGALGSLGLPQLEQNPPSVSSSGSTATPLLNNNNANTTVQVPSNPLTQSFKTLLADVASAMAPSVVNIDVAVERLVQPASNGEGFPFGTDTSESEFFRRFLGFPPSQPQEAPRKEKQTVGQGSGVIVNAEKGYILTNHHVIHGASELVVTLNDKTKLKAKVVGSDALTDLAVVQVTPPKQGLKAAKLGDSGKLRPGDWVLAIGSPLGFDHTVTMGIISALSRQVPDLNENVDFLQTDAAINPGNSGGPLVNLSGEVIGINTAIIATGKAQNIGFTIPSNTVKTITEQLIAQGKIVRPYIGVALQELSPELAKSLGLSANTKGVVVATVSQGSPAAKAGLQQGDVIQRINGELVTNPKDLQQKIRALPIGTELGLQVLRTKDKLVACTLKTEKLPVEE
ncbi:MAG: trypsin-like peptidase domain-containing protein [Vampirovibrio sp.]|nr:trypsin-like peptidase domain-containing protein [Vampirovibrio sp.]